MANVVHNYNVGNILQGPATVFLNLQNPPSAVPPTQGTNTWAASGTYNIDASGQPTDNGSNGFCAGLTEGPTTISFTPKFLEIRGDQYAPPIDAAFTSLNSEIDIAIKEYTLSNLAQYFTSLLGTYTNVSSGANPACDFFQYGSTAGTGTQFASILLISPDHVTTGKFYVVNGYKAYLKSAVQSTFKRDTQTIWKLKFGLIADVTRVAGDLVAQVVRTL